jgi:Ribosomal protein L7/L12 C-terminal domain
VSVFTQWIPSEIDKYAGRPYVALYFLLVVLGIAVVRARQYHRRGQTIPEGLRADLARPRRHRDLRLHARQAAAALPWLADKWRDPTDWPGVVITPAPGPPRYFRGGYDVVLDAAGDTKIRVVSQVRHLTRLPLATAKQLIDGAPVVVLRVPDAVMASAAKSVLEYAGATVSVTDPAESGN